MTSLTPLPYRRNDGGRAAAGFRGRVGDCVTRAIAIATGRPYLEIYNRIADGCARERGGEHIRTAAMGVRTHRKWFREYMRELGFKRCRSTRRRRQLCTEHLDPFTIQIIELEDHALAVIGGVIHDTREQRFLGTKNRVYDVWILKRNHAAARAA